MRATSICFRLAVALAWIAPLAALAQEKIDFNRQVRPILSAHCFKCHGPDDKVRGAGLRLHRRDGAPTAVEADAFVGDAAPDAYERLIDRLLASPRYGERWARRWLDLARYADTNGYEKDRVRSMWPYRDWVIRALNADMPLDQFTIEQLAGDLLPNATESQRI